MAGLTVHSHLPLLCLTRLRFPTVLCSSKQQLLLLTQRQKVTRRLPLRHSAGVTHFTPSRHAGILFSYLFAERRVSATQDCYFDREGERPRSHRFNDSARLYLFYLIIVVNFFLCLIYTLRLSEGCVCVCAHARAGRHIGSVKSALPLLSGTRRGLGRYPRA